MASLRKQKKRQWEEHKSTIRYLYLNKELSHSALVADLKGRGFCVTENQVEQQLKKWKFRRNIDANGWKYIDRRLTKRRQACINTDVFLSGVRLHPPKVERETRRHRFVSTIEKFNPAPSPKTPEYLPLSISTPATLPMQFMWPQNLPWLQSQPILSQLALTIASIMPELSVSPEFDLITQSTVIISESTSILSALQGSKSLSHAAAVIGMTMPESFDGENFTRAEIFLNGERRDAVLEAIKVVLFRSSNDLTELGDQAIFEIFRASKMLSQLGPETLALMSEPTIAAITDKLFRKAILEDDKGLDMVKALLHLGKDVNQAITIGHDYQMPLQFAVLKGTLKLTELLVHAGADINTTFGNRSPLLTLSTQHENHQSALQISKFIISTDMLVEKVSQLNTALLMAALKVNIDLVRFLIQQGASADHCARLGDWYRAEHISKPTVLVAALHSTSWILNGKKEDLHTHKKRLQLAKYLLAPRRADNSLPLTTPAAKVTPDALIAASLSGNTAAIEFLHLNVSGADINACNDRGISPLRACMIHGDYITFKLLLKLGAKFDGPTNPNWGNEHSLLLAALQSGDAGILNTLLNLGAKSDMPNGPNWGRRPTLLHISVTLGNQWALNTLISHGVDVNTAINLADWDDWDISSKHYYHCHWNSPLRYLKTALQVAICENKPSFAINLLKAGARPMDGDLIKVVERKSFDVAKDILVAGGNVNETDSEGRTVLQLALQDGREDIVKMILAKDPRLVGGEGVLAIRSGNIPLAEEFFKKNASWSDRTPGGETILEAAIISQYEEVFDFVIKKLLRAYDAGALCAAVAKIAKGYNLHGGIDLSPEDCAERVHDLAVLKILLKNRGNSKRTNLLEGTAVALAAYVADSQCLKLLLAYLPVANSCILPYTSENDAIVDLSDDYFFWEEFYNTQTGAFWHDDQNIKVSPLFAAVKRKREDIVNKLLVAGYIPDTLTLLAAIDAEPGPMAKTVTALMQHEICMQDMCPGLVTPLQAAVRNKDIELVKLLLSRGANVNAQPGGLDVDLDSFQPARTALQSAVEDGSLEMIKILLDSGAQINAKASYERGATALQLAAIRGFLGIAKMLLDLGADVDAPRSEKCGRTALEGAAEWGRIDMVQLLLNHGVQVKGEGRSQYILAVKLARHNGHHAVERLLVNYSKWNNEELISLEDEELYEEDFDDSGESSNDGEMYLDETNGAEIDEEETENQETDEEETDADQMDVDAIENAEEDNAGVDTDMMDTLETDHLPTGEAMPAEVGLGQNWYAGVAGEDEEGWPEAWNEFIELGTDSEN